MGVWFRRQNKVLHLVRYDEQACVARRMSNERNIIVNRNMPSMVYSSFSNELICPQVGGILQKI